MIEIASEDRADLVEPDPGVEIAVDPGVARPERIGVAGSPLSGSVGGDTADEIGKSRGETHAIPVATSSVTAAMTARLAMASLVIAR